MRLIAVYESPGAAQAAATAVQTLGTPPDEIRVGDPLDQVTSVKGEMRQEMDRTIAGPGNVGPFTPQMAKGMTVGAIAGALIGLVLALPLAAFEFGGWPAWLRLLVAGIVGVVSGSTVGWVVGGGFGAERPDEPLAAEHGLAVSVPASPGIETALLGAHPMRIDLVSEDGTPVRPVYAQPDDSIARSLGRNLSNEDRTE